MTILAFTDAEDGYYQIDSPDDVAPKWAENMTPCQVRPAPTMGPLEKLQELDAKYVLTQRNLRETILLMAEAFKQVTNGAVDLSQVRGVSVVMAVEAEAAELRAQL